MRTSLEALAESVYWVTWKKLLPSPSLSTAEAEMVIRLPLIVTAEAETEAKEPVVKSEELCKLFSKVDSKNPEQVTTAVYLSPSEIQQIATAIQGGEPAKKAIKNATRNDAADIALFGRMIANDPNLNVEAAGMFSHALSTHRADNEIDFFSAVDDRKGEFGVSPRMVTFCSHLRLSDFVFSTNAHRKLTSSFTNFTPF